MKSVAGAPEGQAGEREAYRQLASYRHAVQRIRAAWAAFATRRRDRLEQGLFGPPAEKIAENILEDLFTTVLDWSIPDVNLQIGRADMVLSELGVKRLVVEVKRPGSLVWERPAVADALCQAVNYAEPQMVGAVAVSDGRLFYAADRVNGGLRDRVLVDLDAIEPPEELWWVSVHGIYRPCPPLPAITAARFEASTVAGADASRPSGLLHPHYGLPARCFGYVGTAGDPRTWKLPYLTLDGMPDTRRLPKAIQSILSNYRGAKVDIPRSAVAGVLVRLCRAAATLRKLPCQGGAAPAYVEAHHAVEQLGCLDEVGCCGSCSAPAV